MTLGMPRRRSLNFAEVLFAHRSWPDASMVRAGSLRAKVLAGPRLVLGKSRTALSIADELNRFRVLGSQERAIRRLGRFHQMPLGRYKLGLDLANSHDFLMFMDMTRGRGYEPETGAAVSRILKEGSTFVDVGANNGYFAILALNSVGESGAVVAIEPSSGPLSRLRSNAELNGSPQNLRIVGLAAGSTDCQVEIYPSRYEDGLSSVVRRSRDGTYVTSARLVDILDGNRPTLVKIDVEGAETEVLKGMGETLHSEDAPALIIEWVPRYASVELWKMLSGVFTISTLDGGASFPSRVVTKPADLRFFWGNLLCLPLRQATHTGPSTVR